DFPIFDRIGYVARAYDEQDSATPAAADDLEGALSRLASVWNIAAWLGETTAPDLLTTGADAPDVRVGLDSLSTLHQGFYFTRQQLFAAVAPDSRTRHVAVIPSLSVMTVHAARADSDVLSIRINRLADKPVTVGGAPA